MAVAVIPSMVAMIEDFPIDRAVAFPALSTVATRGEPEFHRIARPGSTFDVASTPQASNWRLWPI